ncbi:ADP-ribosylation factor family-domain-containing protein [Chytridium lagenaria]|nr:ADP-ribosylation factor family-domain-containing protein [Chytridium lagenaria]
MSGNDNVDGAGCLRLLKSRQRTKRKAPLPAFTVAIFGLDGAGKSSALLRLQSNSGTPPKTGWGFATADVHIPYQLFGRRIKFFDLGGSAKIRNIWSNYIAEIHGCIYVIDASNSERFKEAAEAFAVVFDDRRMAGKPFLILSNKQDYSGAARSDDIARLLGVDALGK